MLNASAEAAPALGPASTRTVSSALVALLRELGVVEAYGIMGGAIAPFLRAIHEGGLRLVHFRHEAGASFAAVETSIAMRRPVVVFTTAGPGLANALVGMLAARWDGAHVIFVSACTSAPNRGRVATQETTSALMPPSLLSPAGGPLHLAATIDHPAQLGPVVAQIAAGLTRPGGFVAHLSLPISVQKTTFDAHPILPQRHAAPPSPAIAARHAARLAEQPFVVWLGFGARHAAGPIRALVERTGARVMCSPRAKGIFPEDHPQFLGVTGLGGHGEVDASLTRERPAYTLVLGTRMGESTSFWAPELTPARAFLHVDADASVFGLAYPDVPTQGVVADVGEYVQALLELLPARAARPLASAGPAPEALSPRATGPVRPQFLMAEVQRRFIDEGDAWIMAESGNAFCWATHLLRFRAPGRYRVSTGFGSMGHATTGVVGAALARRAQAVALVGDGAMMMLHEVHTAVQYGADAVWIVLNDACYRMCAQGMVVMGWEPFSCDLPRVDFVALARSLGAAGVRVEREGDVREALAAVALMKGPVVVDVNSDPFEEPPSGRRNRNLMELGTDPAGRSR